MTKDIDYYFTPVSPFSYLGHERFAALAQQYAATIRAKPIDLGKVFPVSGGLPLKQRAPQRQAYRLVELARWRDFLGIPLNPQPKYFPVPADVAAKWIIAASELSTECTLTLSGALMRTVWAEELDVSDVQVVARIAGEQGLDAAALGARASAPEIAARYDAFTQEAIERKVFGAPTYVYRDELFWGQDRLDFLARALAK